ncbi:cytochrome C and Quinol oxidase polypeptide I family protein [Mycobacterium xenopi 4042]|uniref:Cytochrome C and Quinol oxidase polypeptide I family protein n=1 Tax=Mycobacterium xenopi 4042 TaxID=1299334 RepID=X8APC9_MYCXE|nr:cytochrome C and Quinol oxidase polypeptide I family protein [Mycobacterium xenopi 4042]
MPFQARRPFPARMGQKGTLVYKLITTTDHKMIGIMYVVTCYALFFAGGLMALLMRTELAAPGLQFLSNEQYNQLFTMHGTIMLLLYATPIVFGFANLVLPLQIGAPDVAFPRLNAFSYWLFLFGALIVLAGFITRAGRRFRLDRLHPAVQRRAQPGSRWGSVDHGFDRRRSGHHLGWRQHDHHRGVHARAWNDDVSHADLHVEHPGDLDPGTAGLPDPDRRPVRTGLRPAPGRPHLRPGQRRPDPVAAPVLVLRPPRGLHRGAAVLRDRH